MGSDNMNNKNNLNNIYLKINNLFQKNYYIKIINNNKIIYKNNISNFKTKIKLEKNNIYTIYIIVNKTLIITNLLTNNKKDYILNFNIKNKTIFKLIDLNYPNLLIERGMIYLE